MKHYQQRYDERSENQSIIPIKPFIEMVKTAKVENQEWAKRSLLALAITNNVKLAKCMAMRLKIMAVVEELSHFHLARLLRRIFLNNA